MDFARFFYTTTALTGAANAGYRMAYKAPPNPATIPECIPPPLPPRPSILGVTAVAAQFYELRLRALSTPMRVVMAHLCLSG